MVMLQMTVRLTTQFHFHEFEYDITHTTHVWEETFISELEQCDHKEAQLDELISTFMSLLGHVTYNRKRRSYICGRMSNVAS
jgi:hypothetical protein